MYKADGLHMDLFKQCENCKHAKWTKESDQPECIHPFGPKFFMFTCERKKIIVKENKAA